MNISQIKENKLQMILGFSIPSIIAMLLQTMITITDGYFTGNYVGEDALAAINLGLPILYLFLGTGLCTGVGGSVISGRLLGANDKEKASKVMSQTLATTIVICIVVSVINFILFTPILNILNAGEGLANYFTEYYRIMLFTYPLMVFSTVLGMFIRTEGKPQVCMIVYIIACILNVILDYIFVALLGMGVKGSAIGSLIVNAITALFQLAYFLTKSTNLKIISFRFEPSVFRETMLNGSSEFIGEMASAVSMFVFNYVLMKYVGEKGVAAFTILGFVVYGYSMICIGFGQGIIPLVSTLYGAGELDTAIDIRKITNKILFIIGTIIAVIFIFFGKNYSMMFGSGELVSELVCTGFRIYAITFVVMGFNVINSMYFTGIGDAKSSAIISSLRGIVLLLVFTLVLPVFFGMNGVWMSAPLTEVLTALVAVILLNDKKHLCNGELNGKYSECGN
ncbi:MAG: MATE family efflux transporter [Lachnospiraceae bacterium]|nr:MATE family efflux transporter [Lachnospiraceae bacterium]